MGRRQPPPASEGLAKAGGLGPGGPAQTPPGQRDSFLFSVWWAVPTLRGL
jgi:hypothetical protein